LVQSRQISRRPILWQHGIVGFTASWRHAKITPATLHRSDLGNACHGDAEAAGRRAKFEVRRTRRIIAGLALPAAQTRRMARS
jgi:hypothetical protein